MKKYVAMAALALTGFTMPAMANDAISGSVTLTTDYIFRGVSQTDESAALQAGMDYTHETGLHAGIWGSNVDFNTTGDGSLELDLYGGYANTVGQLSYDVGVIYYAYPGAADSLNYDYWEGYLSGGYDFESFAVNAGIYYSPEFTGDTGDAVYYIAGVDVPLPEGFALNAHIGRQEIDDAADYTNWGAGVSKNWLEFDWAVNYHDTNISNNDNADARVVFSVSKSF